MSDNQKKLNEQLVKVVLDTKTCDEVRIKRAKYLIRLGANVNARVKGKSVLSWAKSVNDEKLVEFLKEKGANEWVISQNEAVELGKKLVEAVDVNVKSEVERLIDEGADVNVRSYDDKGWTALMIAVRNRNTEMVELLLQNGADVGQKDEEGNTALIFAAVQDKKEIVEMLIERGANLDDKGSLNLTPLGWAKRNFYNENVEILKKASEEKKAKIKENGGFFGKIFDGFGR